MRHRKGLSRPLNLQLPGVAEFVGDYYCTEYFTPTPSAFWAV